MWIQPVSGSTPTGQPMMIACFWVGAGTKDTGFSLTQLTFQFTHATDSDTNAERDYIINELRKHGVVENVILYRTGDQLLTENVNHYITDGEVAVAGLAGAA